MRKIRTFESIDKICQRCNSIFTTDWKHKAQQFCSKTCMYEWRKNKSWEEVECKHCKTIFKRRKNERHPRTNKKRMFCSNDCSLKSEHRKRILRKWIKNNNPMSNSESVQKIFDTKLKNHGDGHYNNPEQVSSTTLKRYGVKRGYQINPANGHSISKIQKTVYKEVKKIYKNAKLEEYLKDADMSVDIFVPDKKIVIEVNGDYWHMNPLKYIATDYNKSMHMTAQDVWNRDAKRISNLKILGYTVYSVWEKEIREKTYILNI